MPLKRCIPTAGKQVDDGESSEAAVDVTFEDAALALIAGSVEAVAAVRGDGLSGEATSQFLTGHPEGTSLA